ncbi:unnamed protein product, partial [Penicillium nalgiovense]
QTSEICPTSICCGLCCIWTVMHYLPSQNFRLQPSIRKYNIKFQNSNLLHLTVKYDNVGLAEALFQHNANIKSEERSNIFCGSSVALPPKLPNVQANKNYQATYGARWSIAVHSRLFQPRPLPKGTLTNDFKQL